MRKYVNEVTGNVEVETVSVIKSISKSPTGQTPNGANYYSATVDVEFNGKTQKNIRALMYEGNVNAAGGLDKIQAKIDSGESVLTRIAKGTDGRPPLVIVSHLSQGANLSDEDFAWDDVTETVSDLKA